MCVLPLLPFLYCLPDDQAIPPQKHIAGILARATSLRTVRLNLDFHDDTQAYCPNPYLGDKWREVFEKQRGPEIMQAMCPCLEYVALLYHGCPASVWAEFHPQRCAEPRFVLKCDAAHA